MATLNLALEPGNCRERWLASLVGKLDWKLVGFFVVPAGIK